MKAAILSQGTRGVKWLKKQAKKQAKEQAKEQVKEQE